MKIWLVFLTGCLLGGAIGFFAGQRVVSEEPSRGFTLEARTNDDGTSVVVNDRYDRIDSTQNEGEGGPATSGEDESGAVARDRSAGEVLGPKRAVLTLRVQGGPSDEEVYPAVALIDAEGRRMVAVPAESLRGARAAVVEIDRRRIIVDRIWRRDPGGEIAFLTLSRGVLDHIAASPTESLPAINDAFEVRRADAGTLPRRVRVSFFGGSDDRDRGRFVLDRPLLASGVAFASDGSCAGLVLARGEAPAVLAPVAADVLARAETLDLGLDDYRRLYYEGTFEAWLAAAQAHFLGRRYASALEAFRAAERMQPGRLTAAALETWRSCHRALIDAVPAGSSRARFAALEEAQEDFPDDGDFIVAGARTALAIQEWEASLEHWERADRVAPDLVDDLDAAKTGVFRAWADSYVRAQRTRDAIDVLDRALREVQGDAELLALYGRLLLKIRDYAGAAEALRDALRLDPGLESALADLIARADRFTEGPGKVVIDYAPGQRSIIATVRLNDRVSGEFIVDTGATASFIPVGLADRAGLDTSDRVPRVTVRTAGNERRLPYSPLDELSVGALSVRDISVIVGDLPGTRQRGLLGMDFLGQFGFENDAVNGRFVIYEKR